MLNLVSSKVTATPDSSGWSQAYDFQPNSDQEKELRGHLYLVISTNIPQQNIEDISLGRNIVSKIQERYFGDLETDPFSKLKNTIRDTIREFSSSNEKNIEISAMSFVAGTSYVAAFGGGQVYVLRGKSLVKIISSEEGDVVGASGYPQKGDVIVLATKEFVEKIPQETLKRVIEENSFEEGFLPFLNESGRMAANFVTFSQNVFPTDYVTQMPAEAPKTFTIQNNLENTKKTLGSFLSKFEGFAKKIVPERKIYVQNSLEFEAESQNKKLTLSVGVILLIILGVSIIFGTKAKNTKELKSMYEGTLIEANQNLDEAIGLVDVSPEEARRLFVLAQEKLAEVESYEAQDPKIDELKRRIEEQKGLAFGEYKSETILFTDLTLLSSGFKGDLISSSGGNIFVLDKTGKKIVSLEIDTKKSRVVAGPDKIGEVSDLASYSDRVFVLDGDGVKEIESDVNTVIIKDWEGGSLIYGFAGNIYVLDKTANQIYRYAGSGDSFGSKQNWLSSSTKPDFSEVKSWVIDGSVYALNNNGRVQKFGLGSPQAFNVAGIFPEISSIDAIYASDETEFVYLLDKEGKRVVVLDKKGNYKAQYMSNEISNAIGLAVSESEGKIILLTGGKLLSIDIKK